MSLSGHILEQKDKGVISPYKKKTRHKKQQKSTKWCKNSEIFNRFFYEKGTLNRVTITHIVGHLHNYRLNLILLKEPLILNIQSEMFNHSHVLGKTTDS